MKFLESTNFFVRVVMFDFEHRDPSVKLKFRLAPMIHIGSKEYYKNVLKHLENLDEIFYEGINLVDRRIPFYKRNIFRNLDLTFTQYKMVADKLGLVTQSEYFKLKTLNKQLTHTDFNVVSGKKSWEHLKLYEKLKLSILDPIQLFIFQLGLTREILAKHYMTGANDAYLAYGPIEDESGTATNFLMNEREQIIFNKIKTRMETEANQKKTIGIVYGAGHMKSIARYLIDQYNYVPRNGIFVKVFNVVE